MRTVIFDLDGTLVDTSGDLIAAANACFREMGHGDVLDMATDRATAMRGGRPMLRLGLSRVDPGADEAVVEDWYDPLLIHYGAAIATHSVLYPGVDTAVAALAADGYAVGICTNKPVALAEQLMAALAARTWFGSLVGADTLAVRKPDPAPFRLAVAMAGGDQSRALLIGDTDTDHRTARAAGVPSVLVTFGPGGAEVAALAPDALLASYADLSGVVRRLIG